MRVSVKAVWAPSIAQWIRVLIAPSPSRSFAMEIALTNRDLPLKFERLLDLHIRISCAFSMQANLRRDRTW